MKKSTSFTILSLSILLFTVSNLFAQDWPALRGQNGLGTAQPNGNLKTADGVELRIRWKRNLGSGYSSVVIAKGNVVTAYTDGTNDKLICLNQKSGQLNWEFTLAESFKGENGSFDGPITTPLIHDQKVYAIDPAGRVVCVQLEDGELVWSKNLIEDLGATKPLYGFATSPIVAADTLVIQTGTKEKSLAGLDPKTGETKWEVSSDKIDSQTPLAMDFEGRTVVLAAGGINLTGVDPTNGELLFTHKHNAGNASAVMPVPVDGNHIVLTLDDMYSKAFELTSSDDDKIQVSESWQNRSIKNTYNIPALTNGNLFAYSTRILTCVDPESGEAHWKSRAPGDGFLIAIDDHIIINTKQGSLHVAKASSEAYQEVAALKLFDSLVWSLPAYSNNAVFCRSMKEIACVEIVPTGGTADETMNEAWVTSSSLGKSFTSIAAADKETQATKIDEFIAAQSSFPVIDQGIAHFIYRGPTDDVAVASDIFGARQERRMHRVGESDLFVYGVKLESDQRANYMFLVDFKPQLDELNPRSTTSSVYAGEMEFAVRLRGQAPLEMSWFGMADWVEPAYLNDVTGDLKGSLAQKKMDSKIIDSGLNYEIYLPPSYDADAETRYRTVYVFTTPNGRTLGQIDQAVDNIFSGSDQAEHAILVFPTLPPTPEGQRAFIEEFVPGIDKEYRTIDSREGRATAGFGFAAGSAIGLATKHADHFCGSAIYSPLVFGAEEAMLMDALKTLDKSMEIYIEWGRFDMFNPHENWDIREMSQTLAETCKGNSNVTLLGGMVNDSTDWSSWRNRYMKFLNVGKRE